MNQLFREKISLIRDGEIYHFLPLAMFCICDLPARSEIQQIKYVSGYYACPVCLHSGTAIKSSTGKSSYVRYVNQNKPPDIRTHEQTIEDTIECLSTEKSVHGIKGITPLISLPEFDIIQNVLSDQMHGVFLGIVNDMIDIWLGKKNLKNVKNGFKIAKTADRILFNNRIVQLKPYSRISRKPRSLFERSFYKAVEYKNLLWFYIHYALYGILSQAAINHFDLLSAATYTLNKPEISEKEIAISGQMLEKFASDFEYFYGKDSVTMNVHMVRHYAYNVINGGPLWCQSMFGFESRIGDLKKCQRSLNFVSESIVKKYCLTEVNFVKSMANEKIIMLREKTINVSLSVASIFKRFGLMPTTGSLYNIAYEIRFKNDIFKSVSSKNTKSIDHFVRMRDQTVGAIELFVRNNQNFFVLIRKYEISYQKHHFHEIKLKTPIQQKLYSCDEISEKLIYLLYGNIEVVTTEPNKYTVV